MTSTSASPSPPHIILVPGHWLGAWAWDEVLEHLTTPGFHATAMTLPGLDRRDPDRTDRTLSEQADAIQAAVIQTGGDVVLVGHSGANGPVSIAMDRHPELIRRVVWVDSGPMSDGTAFAPDLPPSVMELPLPDFEMLRQQASLEGLSSEHLARFRARAVPEPAAVARETVTLTNDARRETPTTLICCSIPSRQILELARSGDPMFAEVAQLTHVDTVDMPTGHWPMWSRPKELAEMIRAAAHQ